MSDFELCWEDAVSLAHRIAARKLAPQELTRALLDAIRRFNPGINAVVTVDEEQAMEEARLVQKKINASELGHSPLAGVPFLVKDMDCTAGLRTTFGSLIHKNYIPSWDAFHVARMREAGCIVLGKTNTPEDALIPSTFNPVFGVTRNPWNPARCAGGSSGGSASAVAAGLAPLATGSDGAGSIRVPAAINGCFGFKPTFGLIPFGPKGIGVLNTIGHLGPVTRSVADAAAMLDIMAGPDERDRLSLPRPGQLLTEIERPFLARRIAFSVDLGYANVDPEVRELFLKVIDRLNADGWPLEEAHPGFADPLSAINTLVAVEWGTAPMQLEDRDPAAYALQDEPVKQLVRERKALTLEDFWAACQTRKDLCMAMGRFFENYELLLTPALTRAAWEPADRAWPAPADDPAGEDRGITALIYPFNLTCDPACSIPIGLTRDGLPVGLQIVGPRHADALVLQAALAFEQISEFGGRPPHGVAG